MVTLHQLGPPVTPACSITGVPMAQLGVSHYFGGGGRRCFGTASRYPTLTPLHPAGVPAGGPSCTAAATKGDEYVMLRCRWEGGTPPVTLRWRDGGGRALGDPSPSATVLVLSTDSSLGGRDFVCAAAHPLRAAGAECRLRLGKPDPSPATPLPRRGGVTRPCQLCVTPPSLLATQRSPSWRRRGARWRCWKAARRGWRAGEAAAAAPIWVLPWFGTTPRSGR